MADFLFFMCGLWDCYLSTDTYSICSRMKIKVCNLDGSAVNWYNTGPYRCTECSYTGMCWVSVNTIK